MSEPLAVLLLPAALDQYEHAEHARRLLAIPRVVALEPSRHRTPGWLRETIPARQVRRVRLPGEPRLIVLYHPDQYPLARAFLARYGQAELWYLRDPATAEGEERSRLDRLAAERAVDARDVGDPKALAEAEEALRLRFRDLEVISSRPFVPGARIERQ